MLDKDDAGAAEPDITQQQAEIFEPVLGEDVSSDDEASDDKTDVGTKASTMPW